MYIELECDKLMNFYMPALDGLRALAVFAVIFYHIGLNATPGGLLGVNIFFVLSGYLITGLLLNQWEKAGEINLVDFWARRGRRLLPALFALIIILFLWIAFFSPERLSELKWEGLASIFYISNWYLIFHEVSYFESFGPPSPLGHLWSLAIEGQFYLIWPVLLSLGLKFTKNRKTIILWTTALILFSALAMALIYAPGTDPSRVYYGTDTRAFALLMGSLAAMIWSRNHMTWELSVTRRYALDSLGVVSLALIIWSVINTNQYQTYLYQWGLFFFSIVATILVVVLAHPASSLGKIFSFAPLRLVGEWSYGIYLWHYPVIVLTSSLTDTQGPTLMGSLWQIAVTVLLAALSFYFIEKPIRYGKIKAFALTGKVAASMVLIFGIMLAITADDIHDFTKNLLGVSVAQVYGEVEKENEIYQSQEEPENTEDEIQLDSENEIQPNRDGEIEENETKTPVVSGKKWIEELSGKIDGKEILAISDSLLIDAKPYLEEIFSGITIEAKLGRQMYDGPELVAQIQKNKKIHRTVILWLGSNGAFTEKQLRKTLDCLDGAEEIILFNTRVPKPWESVVNETLAKVSVEYPSVRLVDWYGMTKGHSEYFYKDGVHLNHRGIEAYSRILFDELNKQE
jgi:peptidoglycan/LPS O-acetylase OafA/YrhL